jgi:hypothetical protein
MNGPDHLSLLLPMIAMAGAFVAGPAPAYSQTLTLGGEQTGALPKTFETALAGQGLSTQSRRMSKCVSYSGF